MPTTTKGLHTKKDKQDHIPNLRCMLSSFYREEMQQPMYELSMKRCLWLLVNLYSLYQGPVPLLEKTVMSSGASVTFLWSTLLPPPTVSMGPTCMLPFQAML